MHRSRTDRALRLVVGLWVLDLGLKREGVEASWPKYFRARVIHGSKSGCRIYALWYCPRFCTRDFGGAAGNPDVVIDRPQKKVDIVPETSVKG